MPRSFIVGSMRTVELRDLREVEKGDRNKSSHVAGFKSLLPESSAAGLAPFLSFDGQMERFGSFMS